MREKINILVIAPFYDIFIKEWVNSTSNNVNKINVIVHHNYLSEISRYVPLKGYMEHIRSFTKSNILNVKDKPNNVNVHSVSLTYFIPDGSNKKLGDKLANKFAELIEKEKIKFDLIYAHFTWPCGYVGTKLAKEYDVPVVITVHENRDWLLREYNSKNERIYQTWKKADALIRVNQKDIPLLKKFNPNIYSIPNGFNPNKFKVIYKEKARGNLRLPQDKKIIFSLGLLIKRKGFQYLIEAMKNVVKTRNDVLCFIGGSGPLKEKLEKQIRERDLQDYVKLIGFISNEKIGYWMNAADVFVLPSLSESFGIVQIEAMACGKPVVATINGGSEEIITSERYGLLCKSANPEDLAEKILIALEKDWNKEEIREYVKEFTWDNIAKKTFNIYRDMTSRRENEKY